MGETDGRVVLYDAGRQKLFRMDPVSARIWQHLAAGAARGDIMRDLRGRFGIDDSQAAHGVDAALRMFDTLGAAAPMPQPAISASGLADVLAPPVEPVLARRRLRLLDLDVDLLLHVAVPDEDIDLLLNGLFADNTGPAAVAVHVHAMDGQVLIATDELLLAACPRVDQVLPALKGALVRLALARSRDFCAFHAGAVAAGGRCLVIVGGSDSGKSTLVAGLASEGARVLGDDTVVLDAHGLAVRPLPFGICLKEGAWELLESRFDGLADQLVHHDLDERRVRYLSPPFDQLSRPAAVLLFPVVTPFGEPGLARLDRADALERLLAHFCPLGDGRESVSLDILVGWLRHLQAWEVRYSELQDGVAMARGLLGRS